MKECEFLRTPRILFFLDAPTYGIKISCYSRRAHVLQEQLLHNIDKSIHRSTHTVIPTVGDHGMPNMLSISLLPNCIDFSTCTYVINLAYDLNHLVPLPSHVTYCSH